MSATHWESLHRPSQDGQLNHEDLIDYIRSYADTRTNVPPTSWDRISHVTVLADGTVEVGVLRKGQKDLWSKDLVIQTHTRMRDEARERDRIGLAKLGKS